MEKLIGVSVSEWPDFEIIWDLNPASQRFALDGMDKDAFRDDFRQGLDVVWAELADLDANLIGQSRRTKEGIWTIGVPDKTANCIRQWSQGRALTPPYIILIGYKLCVGGGHHRLSIARAKGVAILPLLVEAQEKDDIAKIISFVEPPAIYD